MQTLPKAQRTRGLGIGQEGGGCQSRVLLVFPKLNSPKWEKTLFFLGGVPTFGERGGATWLGQIPNPSICKNPFGGLPLGRSWKNRIFYRKHLPPFTVSFLCFFVYFWPYIMIVCVLKWILHQKSHFHPTTGIPNSSLLPLLLCHKTVR